MSWVVLMSNCTAFGQFWEEKKAEAVAARYGGQVVEVELPFGLIGNQNGVRFDYCPYDGNAIGFDNDWKRPIVYGLFYDLAGASAYRDWYGQEGVAIEARLSRR
jgi:hypothetical protein